MFPRLFLVASRCHIRDFLFLFVRCCYAPADSLSASWGLGWALEVNLNNKLFLLALRTLSLSGPLCNIFIFNKLERVCFCFASKSFRLFSVLLSSFSQRTFFKKAAGRISDTLAFSFLFQECFTINLLFSFPCTPFGSEPYFSWFSLLLHLHVAISSLGTLFEFQHAFMEPSSRKSDLLTHITPFIVLVTHYSA